MQSFRIVSYRIVSYRIVSYRIVCVDVGIVRVCYFLVFLVCCAVYVKYI